MKKNRISLSVYFFLFTSFLISKGPNTTLSTDKVEKPMMEEETPIKIDNLIQALIIVESRGVSAAIGDTHLSKPSIGVLQIRPIMVREVNRILKLKNEEHRFRLEDRYDREKSIKMFMIWKDFHHDDSDDETISRSWNGGPRGNKNPKTIRYWERVERVLLSL